MIDEVGRTTAAPALAEAGVLDTGAQLVQPDADGGALDIDVLTRQIDDEPTALHAPPEDFLGPVSGEPTIINGPAVADEFGEIGSAAHRLKSSARSVGAAHWAMLAPNWRTARVGGTRRSRRGQRRRRSCGPRAAATATGQLRRFQASRYLEANSSRSERNDDENPAGR